MTFVLNLLHGDYSLLAADRQANTEGPTTITIGNITIHAQDGATIQGFQKMKISRCGTVAIGIAGTVRGHSYFEDFEKNEGIDSCVKTILDSAHSSFSDRGRNLGANEQQQNQGIATFFDSMASQHFSLLYIYTPWELRSRWYKAVPGKLMLIHVGTGSDEFERTLGLQQINDFIEEFRANADPYAAINWIKNAFEEVSKVAKGVGKEPQFFVSTRSQPAFAAL